MNLDIIKAKILEFLPVTDVALVLREANVFETPNNKDDIQYFEGYIVFDTPASLPFVVGVSFMENLKSSQGVVDTLEVLLRIAVKKSLPHCLVLNNKDMVDLQEQLGVVNVKVKPLNIFDLDLTYSHVDLDNELILQRHNSTLYQRCAIGIGKTVLMCLKGDVAEPTELKICEFKVSPNWVQDNIHLILKKVSIEELANYLHDQVIELVREDLGDEWQVMPTAEYIAHHLIQANIDGTYVPADKRLKG